MFILSLPKMREGLVQRSVVEIYETELILTGHSKPQKHLELGKQQKASLEPNLTLLSQDG